MNVSEGMYNILGGFFVFCFGACLGSFLNVVAYRLPRNLSLVRPPSSCPHCGKQISALGLIPILGYFLVGMKCASCKKKISPRYPLVEFVSGALTTLVVFRFLAPADLLTQLSGNIYAQHPTFGAYHSEPFFHIATALWVLYTGIALTLIDLDYRILPDVITIPGTLVGFLLGALNPLVGWQSSLMGIAIGGGSLFLVARLYELVRKREGMGMGDVKYLAFIGAVLGWQQVIVVIAMASMIGSVIGLIVVFWKRQSMNVALPFGPFLAMAAFIMTLWGEQIFQLLYPSSPS